MSKIDLRSEKRFKKRIDRSPVCSTAAETLLMLTRQIDKPETEYNTGANNSITRKSSANFIKKSMKRTQSTEYFKTLAEKNLRIKNLKNENLALTAQLIEFSALKHKYQRIRNLLSEKDNTIECLWNSLEKIKSAKSLANLAETHKLRKNSKSIKKTGLKIRSRLSLDQDFSTAELQLRPLTSVNNPGSVKTAKKTKPCKIQPPLPPNLLSVLQQTEEVLQGWKAFCRRKSNFPSP